MKELVFEPIKHHFFVAGVRKPSITEVLNASGLFDNTHFTDEGRERGTRIHQAIELMHKGALDWSAINEDDIGYIQSYEKFLLTTGFKPYGWEEKLYSELYDFAGIPDVWGLLNERVADLEIKTGVERRRYERLQTAGQLILLRENYPGLTFQVRFGLHLDAAGGMPKLGEPFLKHTKDIQEFAALKTLWNLKNTKEAA